MRYKKIILLILDGCGVGVQEDYFYFHSAATNTLGNVYKAFPDLRLPFMESLGLSKILDLGRTYGSSLLCYGKMREKTAGNDTFAGVWEMFGTLFDKRFVSNQQSLDVVLIDAIKKETGILPVGNVYLSGYIALDKYFNEHMRKKSPILYLSDDGVILLAAHEDVMDAATLNAVAARFVKPLFGKGFVRIITRPFHGRPGNFIRDEASRKDFLLVDIPKRNLITELVSDGIKIRVTYHLARIFNYPPGLSVLEKSYNNNEDLFSIIEEDMAMNFNLQIYVVPDTDNVGHRKDVEGFAGSLKKIDQQLDVLSTRLESDDLLMVTADHGCDPTSNLRGHCREFVPILLYTKKPFHVQNLGVRRSFSDVGQTIAENFSARDIHIGTAF